MITKKFEIDGTVCYHAGMKEWMQQYLQFDRTPTESSKIDTIVVLGTSKTLECFDKRINTALFYAEVFPQASVIFSGKEPDKRKGYVDESGDDYLEASIMADVAIKKGLDPSRTKIEKKSTNAKENVINSLAMIPHANTVLFVTSGYLGRRVDLYAQKQQRENYFVVDSDVQIDASDSDVANELSNKQLLYEASRIIRYGLKGDL